MVTKLCISHTISNIRQASLSFSLKCTRKFVEPMMYPNAVKKSAMARRVITFCAPVLMSSSVRYVKRISREPRHDRELDVMEM